MINLIKSLVLALFLGAAALVPFVLPAQAQDIAESVDLDAWRSLAQRAEEVTAAARASNEALEVLRADLVTWRELFLGRQGVNAARIETLLGQLEALGPAPEEGETEAEELATRRADLTVQLSEAQSPVRAAEEHHSRAVGLIREIDKIIRDRQAEELLNLGPSPANPTLWPDALADLRGFLSAVGNELTTSLQSDAKRGVFRSRLPQTILYLVIAGLLVFRGRRTMEWLTALALERSKGRARWIAGFVTSLGQILVPVLGILLLVEALKSTTLPGLRGTILLDTLPALGVSVFGARWMLQRLYPLLPDSPRPMPGTPEQAREMRLYGLVLGFVVGLMAMLSALIAYEDSSLGSRAVLTMPLIVVAGLVLFRMGRILTSTARIAIDESGSEPTFGLRVQLLVGKTVTVLGILGPTAGMIGYLQLAVYFTFPLALTLALLALLRVLHDLVVELYAIASRIDHQTASEALVPVLISFVLTILSLPLLALIWGARVADLTELWTKFLEGYSFGETQISPKSFITFAVVFSALYIFTRMVQGGLKSSVLPKTKMDLGGQTAVVSGVGYVGITLSALIAITAAGIDLSGLAIVAGALSVGIGFGLQNIVSNFVAGVILLVERPVSQGDWVEVGGTMGIVRDISVRSTRIETFDRNDVIVPNADFISGAVKNWTRGNVIGRVTIPVGVAYGSDTRKVERILKEVAIEHPLVALDPEPGVDFLDFGASSLDFQIRAVLRDINFGLSVRTEIRHRISERFAEEGIEIPFAQQDIWIRNPEAFAGKKPAGPVTPEDGPIEPVASSDGPSGTGEGQG